VLAARIPLVAVQKRARLAPWPSLKPEIRPSRHGNPFQSYRVILSKQTTAVLVSNDQEGLRVLSILNVLRDGYVSTLFSLRLRTFD
jgi:hypothetical protein